MKKLLLIFILSILGIAGILYYQNFNSPVLAGSMVYPQYGGTGTSTKNWSGGCVNVTSGVWGTTSCGGAGGGTGIDTWDISGSVMSPTNTIRDIVINTASTTMGTTTISGTTTLTGFSSCGKLFTNTDGVVSCGVDSTGGSGGIDTWNIVGTTMTATDTVRQVTISAASTTLGSTTISGPLTYASTSKWDLPYYWLVGTGSILMSYNQASSTYLITGTSTAGITINAAKQVGTDGLICKYSDASTTYWSTAYSWGNHASAGYMTNFATSLFMTNFATSVFALDTDLNNYMTTFNTSVFALDTDLSIYMTNFATSMFMTTFATSVFALDTDLSAYMTTFATSVFALDTDLSAYMTTFATSVFLTGSTGLTTFATSVFALDTDLNNYMTTFATSVFLTNQTGLTTFATSVFVLDTDYSNYLAGTTSKRTASINFLNTTTTEPYRRATFRVPGQVTITQIGCYTGGGESQMAFYESVYTNPNVTTSILTADITCDYDSQTNGALLDSIVGATGLITTYVAGVNAASTTYVWINYTF